MTRITLIRHCEAQGNYQRLFQGHTDAPVSDNGRIQLDLLAVRCRNMKFDALYSSPLTRALETAKAVNRYHHLPIQIREGLMEINGGRWEGMPWADIPNLYPEESDKWNYEPYDFCPQGGESMRHVCDRMWNTITGIVRENPGKEVCVVSHGCAIRAFLCRAKGLPLEKLNEVDWCDNTALSVIEFASPEQSKVILENDASHLTEEVSSFLKQDWWKPEKRIRARP